MNEAAASINRCSDFDVSSGAGEHLKTVREWWNANRPV